MNTTYGWPTLFIDSEGLSTNSLKDRVVRVNRVENINVREKLSHTACPPPRPHARTRNEFPTVFTLFLLFINGLREIHPVQPLTWSPGRTRVPPGNSKTAAISEGGRRFLGPAPARGCFPHTRWALR